MGSDSPRRECEPYRRDAGGWVRTHKWVLDEHLPEAGEEWMLYETDLDDPAFRKLVYHDAIKAVGMEYIGSSLTNVYETEAWVHDLVAESIADSRIITPCGHDGFSNPEGVVGLQCTVEHCGEIFDKSEVYER